VVEPGHDGLRAAAPRGHREPLVVAGDQDGAEEARVALAVGMLPEPASAIHRRLRQPFTPSRRIPFDDNQFHWIITHFAKLRKPSQKDLESLERVSTITIITTCNYETKIRCQEKDIKSTIVRGSD
jgi:hypothetical protein